MVSQPIIVGIVVGVFFAGFGVGYAVLQSTITTQPMMMTPQQMANNPQLMDQWNQYMMQNPKMSDQWTNTMINNPTLMHSIMSNPQFQQTWMAPWLSNSTNWNHMMNSGWMNQNMNYGRMGSGMMGGQTMMGTPITQLNDVLVVIGDIEKILDDVSKNYRNNDRDTAFNLATNAYLENYEYVEGAIAQKDRPLMEKIELMLRVDLRSMIQNGDSIDNVDSKINSIKSELSKVKTLFQ